MAELDDWHSARLLGTRDLSSNIRLLEICSDSPVEPPAPGSHIRITVRICDRADIRSYSVVSVSADRTMRIAVKRAHAGRGGSAYLWSLTPGALLTITTPRNRFPLGLGRPGYLLIAGGIGITPLVGMAQALAEAGAHVRMLYAVRRRADAVFGAALAQLLGDRLELAVSAEAGRLDVARAIATLPAEGEAYVCGPIGLLEAARLAWRENGRSSDRLRFETFGNSGRYATEAFNVSIPRLGLHVHVPAERSMLEALEAAGVAMIHDCQRGECGLCALPILAVEGAVDHRDVFFSDAEHQGNQKLCTCVSRLAGGGTITLDTGDR